MVTSRFPTVPPGVEGSTRKALISSPASAFAKTTIRPARSRTAPTVRGQGLGQPHLPGVGHGALAVPGLEAAAELRRAQTREPGEVNRGTVQ